MDRHTLVYMETGAGARLAGRLWTRVRNQRESATFEYDKSWLASPERFALEPALQLGPGPHHTAFDQTLFGAIGDSAPDRWGRILLRRAERRRAELAKETPRTLRETDFLLLVDDESRLGALRFRAVENGPFLNDAAAKIPLLIEVPRLLLAAERFVGDRESEEDLRMLLAPGSSLGGARPKACVRDRDAQLSIAKFPQKGDEVNVVLWEAVALALAAKAGIRLPAWRLERVAKKPVLLVRRFDRAAGARIPFLSAMSMLGARDNESRSYMEIVDALRRHGAAWREDARELWRRVAFNVLISNTDDHLRNHGFLYAGPRGWRLSPAYDLNPVPIDLKPRVLATSITVDDASASLDLAMETAPYFGLGLSESRKIAAQVAKATSAWRKEAAKNGLTNREIDRMSSAFEHEDRKAAKSTVPA
ncbi:MAG: type II toxin-antitoxin system HipA family toxin [Candidatus Solibacter usitatus]|nr:type II toxin-antitoxin system HipA family toxin [Candidatus Solibacter usitatus]